MAQSTKRIVLLDEIRGFAIFCMIFFHAFYTMYLFFSYEIGNVLIKFFSPLEPYFAGLFIFISGICSTFSHSNFKRGLKLSAAAILITLVSYIFFPSEIIIFGILHFLSLSILIYACIQKLIKKINPVLGLIISIILFILTLNVEKGFFGFSFSPFFIPESLKNIEFLCIFGIKSNSFYSSDYFPLLPWIFIFFAGIFSANYLKDKQLPNFIYNDHIKFFSWLGRNSLLIYIIHQPIIYAVFWLINIASSIFKI